jgi:hypothetical protein
MSSGVKLNIGCGLSVLPGFDNLDNSPSVWLARHPVIKWILYRTRVISEQHYRTQWPSNIIWRDASRRLPYPSRSVEKIYSSHFLEHVPHTTAIAILKECHRVLKLGGRFRLVVPDLLYHAKTYVARTEEMIEAGSLNREAHDTFLQSMHGKYLARLRSGHCYMYDWPTLHVLLTGLDFKSIRRREFGISDDDELGALDNRPEDSLIVEMIV